MSYRQAIPLRVSLSLWFFLIAAAMLTPFNRYHTMCLSQGMDCLLARYDKVGRTAVRVPLVRDGGARWQSRSRS